MYHAHVSLILKYCQCKSLVSGCHIAVPLYICVFTGVPGPIENIETAPSFKSVTITWDAQTNTGCSQLVRYQGVVIQVDTNKTVSSIDTTVNSYTVSDLYHNSQYLISLSAINELGNSSSVNTTIWTKAIGN